MDREALRQELAGLAADAKQWVQARRASGEAKVLLNQPLPPGRDEELPSVAAPLPEMALAAEAAANPKPQPPWAASLEAFGLQVRGCRRCGLAAKRQHLVFGEGDPHAQVVFVGEGPGTEEDAQGRPFVGAAGQLLDKIIAGMGSQRSKAYLCSLVKCRPPFSREPGEDEVAACLPYLEQQLALIQPKVIVALGRLAAQALTGRREGIAELRGQEQRWRGILLVPTYPPSALLQDAALKRPVWEDMKRVLEHLKQLES
jgi:DNA polymerase